MTPRFEFRVFGDDLSAERQVLRRRGGSAGDDEARTDICFVVPGRTDASLKLREDRLDLKLLRDEREGLELWQPAGRADLPVAPETLQDALLGPAGVRLDLPSAPVGRDLMLALGRAAPGTRLVRVEKRRRNYCVDGVAAECTRLLVDGRPVESIAVEQADLALARGTVAALGLSGRRNTSYQRWLVETVLRAAGGAAGA